MRPAAVMLCLALCVPPLVEAESRTRISATRLSPTEQSQATAWQLTDTEWLEYKRIMAGPRGNWSPDLDPVTVLGIEAESDAERRRYAELLARIEHGRSLKESRFQLEYDRAIARLYPRDRLYAAAPYHRAGRLALVAGLDDSGLGERIRRYAPIHGVDIFIKDASNAQIRRWASETGLPPELVRTRQITLNHYNPATLPDTDRPAFFLQQAGKFIPYEE